MPARTGNVIPAARIKEVRFRISCKRILDCWVQDGRTHSQTETMSCCIRPLNFIECFRIGDRGTTRSLTVWLCTSKKCSAGLLTGCSAGFPARVRTPHSTISSGQRPRPEPAGGERRTRSQWRDEDATTDSLAVPAGRRRAGSICRGPATERRTQRQAPRTGPWPRFLFE